MNKRIVFTIADEGDMKYATKMVNSLRKFHSEEDLEVLVITGDDLKSRLQRDPMFFYRATPVIAKELWAKGYREIIKIDADSVITSDISHLWKETIKAGANVGVVNNGNPRETKKYPVSVWNIHPYSYVNAGLVVMTDERFINHWLNLCFSVHFDYYQMKEQDLLNIMVFYMDFKVMFLDAGKKWHGLISKGYWPQCELIDDKLILPKNEEYPANEDKEICVIHFAGGRMPDKMNFDLFFKEDVSKWLKKLTK